MKKIIRNIIPILIFIILFGKSNDQIVQAQTSDPGISGSLDISQQEYDYGDEYFEPANLSGRLVELKASVHYPTNMSGGSFPLIIFMHGRHDTCFVPDTGDFGAAWPCPSPSIPIPSYQGYDYISEVLASHGYIVVSVSANGINTYDNDFANALCVNIV